MKFLKFRMTDQPKAIKLAVIAEHLSGEPLNYQLLDIGATLSKETKTAPKYRLFELNDHPKLRVRRAGLAKTFPEGVPGFAIRVEIWEIPEQEWGKLAAMTASPIHVGAVELSDGSTVGGFICQNLQPYHKKSDISSSGGWKAFQLSKPRLEIGFDSILASTDLVFKKILVANRGEIAVRIASTLKKLGYHVIAIYSEEDRYSRHVEIADSSFLLEGNTVPMTYLDQTQIVEIARKNKADAIIPGYGFLSENAEFAELCDLAGITWIGPTPSQMRALGLKHIARAVAQICNVPVIPGSAILKDLSHAVDQAKTIGYPVMLKSTAGGGGIGLKKCETDKELRAAFDSVKHSGQSYFKSDKIFLESLIEDARHIEVQIIGDGLGGIKTLGTRECSLQRRHQKLIEEGPVSSIPKDMLKEICEAAVRLVAYVKYRNIGTVEFIYDRRHSKFYFLEVNTRLQVEHPVTEMTSGHDLVELMVKLATSEKLSVPFIAMDEVLPALDHSTLDQSTLGNLTPSHSTLGLSALGNSTLGHSTLGPSTLSHSTLGHSIEVRIYAENPIVNFQPSSGEILTVEFPKDVRVDTWIQPGTKISLTFDPLLAKLIVMGDTRPAAVSRLIKALGETSIWGVQTNLEYLKLIVKDPMFMYGDYSTCTLQDGEFQLYQPAIQVIEPGTSTTIQDHPGRIGWWHVGIPPSGPMDDLSFCLANRILRNNPKCAGLECTSNGPSLKFLCATTIVVVGPPADFRIDDKPKPLSTPVLIHPLQTLTLSAPVHGARMYIAVKGGIQVPLDHYSRSTFTLAKMGGMYGRELCTGDILPILKVGACEIPGMQTPMPVIDYEGPWILRVMAGPHAFPDYFEKASWYRFFNEPWKVHYNSNRVGLRLIGPKPVWARTDGGDAGLHPSNIHDSPYAIGSISFTGDEAIILTCDGPSLGGFVVFATVVVSDLWKMGQMRPGDEVRLCPVSASKAMQLRTEVRNTLTDLVSLPVPLATPIFCDAIVGKIMEYGRHIVVRQAGDRNLLLEFGEDKFDLKTNFHIHAFVKKIHEKDLIALSETTPGVRSLLVEYDPDVLPEEVLAVLRAVEQSLGASLPRKVNCRYIEMPIVFDHPTTLAAVERYKNTIRSEAPYLPSNVEFLQKINALPQYTRVFDSVLKSSFIVLGLGDVFCGSPCAIPLDPRHRLFGTKYSPNRSFTPEGTVGIGGQYLCIYGTDSPGGYQLVGRTLPIFNRFDPDKKWLLNIFDQINFYMVPEETLNAARAARDQSLIRIFKDELNLDAYETMVTQTAREVEIMKEQRMNHLTGMGILDQLIAPYQYVEKPAASTTLTTSLVRNSSMMLKKLYSADYKLTTAAAGKCWKISVQPNQMVNVDDEIACLEAMKMEIRIMSPIKGQVVKLGAEIGQTLEIGDVVAIIRPIRHRLFKL
ncbi:hypothetical protein BP6252_06115 [Coleophoma cylindrospora]|uniref:Urea carboxylase n=1 Tax=Coleophoma cylindrospora TaxID=1849047 RepID=A0A3D8RLQ9_9HELO|nr:hypothetical protein BP6252_06115 [Coleophoma cylindrospora]